MDATKRRIKRMGPLLRVRQLQLDHEAFQLEKIKELKSEAQRQLREFQMKYMSGVNMLNQVRNSSDRQYLSMLESGLDLLKSKWYKTLKTVKEIENLEKAQLANVLNARKNMKTMETLKERYIELGQQEETKRDLKVMDDNAVRKFVNNMIENNRSKDESES